VSILPPAGAVRAAGLAELERPQRAIRSSGKLIKIDGYAQGWQGPYCAMHGTRAASSLLRVDEPCRARAWRCRQPRLLAQEPALLFRRCEARDTSGHCACAFPAAASVSGGQPEALARDEARQHRPPELRLLLSPGLSERLVHRSTDEWSSSNSGVSLVTRGALPFRAKQQRLTLSRAWFLGEEQGRVEAALLDRSRFARDWGTTGRWCWSRLRTKAFHGGSDGRKGQTGMRSPAAHSE
jgi:hypothetical protein